METYLVGGAVRDKLLGLPVQDRDWVVVGASIDDMLNRGFKQVGKDFPVFLHPDTHEQYALARTERKTGPGHRGFDVDSSSRVTLEQDLLRRDLTVNAMAESRDGQLIDPCGGQQDLARRCLRHTSEAFAEDPLRVLRVARFAARFHHMQFTVAPETMALMQQVVNAQELQNLPPERVWQELEQALVSDAPARFVEILQDCGALAVVLPELDRLFRLRDPSPQSTGSVAVLTLRSLQEARKLSSDVAVLYATLVHDVVRQQEAGEQVSAAQPPEPGCHAAHHPIAMKAPATGGNHSSAVGQQPHAGPDANTASPVIDGSPASMAGASQQTDLGRLKALQQRLPLPRECAALALLVCRHRQTLERLPSLDTAQTLTLLESLDTLRRPERTDKFLLVCEATMRGHHPQFEGGYQPAITVRDMHAALSSIDTSALLRAAGPQAQPQQILRKARLAALHKLRGEPCHD